VESPWGADGCVLDETFKSVEVKPGLNAMCDVQEGKIDLFRKIKEIERNNGETKEEKQKDKLRQIKIYKQSVAKALVGACFGVDTTGFKTDENCWMVHVYEKSTVEIHFVFVLELVLLLIGLGDFSDKMVQDALTLKRKEKKLRESRKLGSKAIFESFECLKKSFQRVPVSFFSPVSDEELRDASPVFDEVKDREEWGYREFLVTAFDRLCASGQVFIKKRGKLSFDEKKADLFWQFRKAVLGREFSSCIACPCERQQIEQSARRHDEAIKKSHAAALLWGAYQEEVRALFDESLADFAVYDENKLITGYFTDLSRFRSDYKAEIEQDRKRFNEEHQNWTSDGEIRGFLYSMADVRTENLIESERFPKGLEVKEEAKPSFILLLAHAILKEAIK
jgi:hypothetical protein